MCRRRPVFSCWRRWSPLPRTRPALHGATIVPIALGRCHDRSDAHSAGAPQRHHVRFILASPPMASPAGAPQRRHDSFVLASRPPRPALHQADTAGRPPRRHYRFVLASGRPALNQVDTAGPPRAGVDSVSRAPASGTQHCAGRVSPAPVDASTLDTRASSSCAGRAASYAPRRDCFVLARVASGGRRLHTEHLIFVLGCGGSGGG